VIKQEDDPAIGDWAKITGNKIQAVTTRDDPEDLKGSGRVHIPETITFHPLWLKLQRERKFNGWTDELFQKHTHPNAAKEYEDKSKDMGMGLGPVDGLLDISFARNLFHEVRSATAQPRYLYIVICLQR
jgi:hypothetical protein